MIDGRMKPGPTALEAPIETFGYLKIGPNEYEAPDGLKVTFSPNQRPVKTAKTICHAKDMGNGTFYCERCRQRCRVGAAKRCGRFKGK